ncbi:MAG: hypothetical protein Q4D34_01725 [Eggerthellaceae bacterium]|nr:hypothetical protein [Eggerthellaceae bacterium]
MAERAIENNSTEIPEFPELLEQVLLFTLDEGKEKIEQEGEVVPFSVLVIKDNIFIETHPGEDAEMCFAQAQRTVAGARGADAYAFCYDGYADTDAGQKDMLIAEGGLPGEDVGYAVGYLYTLKADGTIVFEDEPMYIGEAPNFMAGLKDASEYSDEEIDEKYIHDDDCDCGCNDEDE